MGVDFSVHDTTILANKSIKKQDRWIARVKDGLTVRGWLVLAHSNQITPTTEEVRKVQISRKYGVNPSMGVCFWCGGDTGEILLCGHLKGDREAPRRMVTNYGPCESCKKGFALGIAVFEITDTPAFEGMKPLQDTEPTRYPTGRMVVIDAKSNHPFGDRRRVMVGVEQFTTMFGEALAGGKAGGGVWTERLTPKP
jgi:hypothetical protein